MKILVTGGSGYIGSHTLLELANAGYTELISADNFLRSTPASLQRIEQICGVHVRNYEVDLTDAVATRAIFEAHPDLVGVIHFAALKTVPESVEQPLLYYRNNLQSLVNVLEGVQNSAVKTFVFSSSCSVYGNIEVLPVNEETPIGRQESPYAETKRMGEQMIEALARQLPKTQFMALRYFNPAGAHPSGMLGEWPIDPPQALVPVIMQVAAGQRPELVVYGNDYDTRDGTCIRDYVHVSDIARAHVLALDYLSNRNNQQENFYVINLGSGQGTTVLEAIEAFERITGQQLPHRIGSRRPGDVAAIYSDCSRARNLLQWQPEFFVDDMIQTAWNWQNEISRN